ncbi:MAG: hypothetical protein K6E59_04900 [Bacilli bacterium]|nr:hypothetical protein [Bacilli bacterium]
MILILGSHQDDVLYCSSLLNKRVNDTLLGRFPMAKGDIFNQEVLIVSGLHTSILGSAVTSYLLTQNYVNLIIVLGKCYALDSSFKPGQIVMAREIIDLDVDQIDVANATLGQVPGMPAVYHVQKDLIGYVRDGFSKRTLTGASTVTMLSSDNLNSPVVAGALRHKTVLGQGGPFVVDSLSYGVAVAGMLQGVPCLSVKAVERNLADKKSIEGYIDALDTYVDIGKAVVYTIGDIGRSDVLRLRRGA